MKNVETSHSSTLNLQIMYRGSQPSQQVEFYSNLQHVCFDFPFFPSVPEHGTISAVVHDNNFSHCTLCTSLIMATMSRMVCANSASMIPPVITGAMILAVVEERLHHAENVLKKSQ